MLIISASNIGITDPEKTISIFLSITLGIFRFLPLASFSVSLIRYILEAIIGKIMSGAFVVAIPSISIIPFWLSGTILILLIINASNRALLSPVNIYGNIFIDAIKIISKATLFVASIIIFLLTLPPLLNANLFVELLFDVSPLIAGQVIAARMVKI